AYAPDCATYSDLSPESSLLQLHSAYQFVISAASSVPPSFPSLPYENRSYSPCSPGARYTYLLPQGSSGTAFLRYGPAHFGSFSGRVFNAARPCSLVG